MKKQTQQLAKKALEYVQKLKPKTTAKARSYARAFWDKVRNGTLTE